MRPWGAGVDAHGLVARSLSAGRERFGDLVELSDVAETGLLGISGAVGAPSPCAVNPLRSPPAPPFGFSRHRRGTGRTTMARTSVATWCPRKEWMRQARVRADPGGSALRKDRANASQAAGGRPRIHRQGVTGRVRGTAATGVGQLISRPPTRWIKAWSCSLLGSDARSRQRSSSVASNKEESPHDQ